MLNIKYLIVKFEFNVPKTLVTEQVEQTYTTSP